MANKDGGNASFEVSGEEGLDIFDEISTEEVKPEQYQQIYDLTYV